MAKALDSKVKMRIQAGKATPAPPVGSALGAKGVNIQQFVQAFNAQTADLGDQIVQVYINVYDDKSFDFSIKTPPTAQLIKQALKIEHGSGEPHVNKVGELTKEQLQQIAETKMKDLNANDIEAAMKVVQGTARAMGVRVEGVADTGTYTAKRKGAQVMQVTPAGTEEVAAEGEDAAAEPAEA
jgi:large subunit ribosomal protein L11